MAPGGLSPGAASPVFVQAIMDAEVAYRAASSQYVVGDEATVKRWGGKRGGKITLLPENPAYEPIEVDADEVNVYGKVVTVLRRL